MNKYQNKYCYFVHFFLGFAVFMAGMGFGMHVGSLSLPASAPPTLLMTVAT